MTSLMVITRFSFFLLLFSLSLISQAGESDGLWIRYNRITDPVFLKQYRNAIHSIYFPGSSPVQLAAKSEITKWFGNSA
jgi:alpha-glucuronidase